MSAQETDHRRIVEPDTGLVRSVEFLILTGKTLPVFGGIFAAVIAAMSAADIINITAGTKQG
jgi:hypothetical protein